MPLTQSLCRYAAVAALAMLCAAPAAYAQTAASSVSDQAAASDADHDYSAWAADPTAAGPDLPPAGRSLFDHWAEA